MEAIGHLVGLALRDTEVGGDGGGGVPGGVTGVESGPDGGLDIGLVGRARGQRALHDQRDLAPGGVSAAQAAASFR